MPRLAFSIALVFAVVIAALPIQVASSNEIIPIGAVQGIVADGDGGTTHRSPYAPSEGNEPGATFVTVQAVVYQRTLARTADGGRVHGFFLQNTAATADADPRTSDGIFVHTGPSATIGTYAPRVGDEIVLRARVAEFFHRTQLVDASLVRVVRTGVAIDAEVPAFEVAPPDSLLDAQRYWERREGMRARIPAGSVVLNGRNVFSSTLDGEVWLARGDHPVATRTDPYARRTFRDAHPLDNAAGPFNDGNGYRIVLGSLGVKATADDPAALIAPARTFDSITNAPAGGVYFSFGKYQIQVTQDLALRPGVDPAGNAPPRAFDRAEEYSIATFNVENLYDHRDDPFDDCDFPGNPGCVGINPPYNYVPASNEVYQARLVELASQILSDLKAPDIIMLQEVEDQDICIVVVLELVCGDTNNADGKPDTVQELALAIARLGGPTYAAAADRDGADRRGIISAYLFRVDRVELAAVTATHPIFGSQPAVVYRTPGVASNADVQNPKTLNAALPDDIETETGTDGPLVFSRAPQVALFRIARQDDRPFELYVLNNHFSSRPNARVGQRTEQARYNAAIVDAIRLADPGARIIAGGDLNVYPRPDDPFGPGHDLHVSDQLAALYAAGLTNLYDVLVAEVPASAYTYIFQGQAQTLDMLFVSDSLRSHLASVRVAHVNADFPAAHTADGPRGASDHDAVVARFRLP